MLLKALCLHACLTMGAGHIRYVGAAVPCVVISTVGSQCFLNRVTGSPSRLRFFSRRVDIKASVRYSLSRHAVRSAYQPLSHLVTNDDGEDIEVGILGTDVFKASNAISRCVVHLC